jgi:hypothetical protein
MKGRPKLLASLAAAALALGTLRGAAAAGPGPSGDAPPCRFDQAPFIKPALVQDLYTWESDHGDQVLALDLAGSQGSNRYFDPPAGFTYRYIGRTPDGIDVLFTSSSQGGSGVFRSLMLVRLRREPGLAIDAARGRVAWGPPRWVLKKLGELPLGDRWDGTLTLTGRQLHVHAQGEKERVLSLNLR